MSPPLCSDRSGSNGPVALPVRVKKDGSSLYRFGTTLRVERDNGGEEICGEEPGAAALCGVPIFTLHRRGY
jgi:hypothetical protein